MVVKIVFSFLFLIFCSSAFCHENSDRYAQAIQLDVAQIETSYKKEDAYIRLKAANYKTIFSEDCPEPLRLLYFNIYVNRAKEILARDEKSPHDEASYKQMSVLAKILSDIEYRENLVDEYNDKVVARFKHYVESIYQWRYQVGIDYVSWQQFPVLQGAAIGNKKLVSTNRGLCYGGSVGRANKFQHYSLNLCYLMGSGSIDSTDTAITYNQSKVKATGFKMAPSYGRFVSETGSELGVRGILLYNLQKFASPPDPTYTLTQPKTIELLVGIYSKWLIGSKYYFQTDFAKYISQDSVLWSLGGGFQF